jgi:HK97 family phage prohead protease
VERPSPTERITKDFAFELKAVSDKGIIEGYASTFGNVDSAGDIIAPGAFARTLASWNAKGQPVPVLWQHDAYEPIGATVSISEDERGLRVKAQLVLDVQQAREALALAKARVLGGMSIGFSVPAVAADGKDAVDYDEGLRARVFREVRLWEYSLVTFPANEQATIESAKTAPEWAQELTSVMREVRDHIKDDELRALMREVRSAILTLTDRPARSLPSKDDALAGALREANTLLRAHSRSNSGRSA